MGADEGRLGMSSDHPKPLLMEFRPRWKILAVEEPVGMVVKLVPPLVLGVEGSEEGARVSRVNHHGAPVPAAKIPERVDPRVVNSEQPAVLAANAQPQRFVDF